MKTKFIYAILAIAVLSIASCSRDEDSLFDKNPTERANEAMSNILTTLPAAPNGWDMVYFANPESQGYHVLIKFAKDGRATVAAKNALTTRDRYQVDSTSVWEVLLDYGPILTFNTYNKIMHAWADPQNDGNGYLGDYEFLILETTPSLIRLKGKKHSAYCYLRPVPADKNWEDFFTETKKLADQWVGNANLLLLNKGGKSYMLYPTTTNSEGSYILSSATSGLMTTIEKGKPFDADESNIYPYAVIEEGIQMQYGFFDDKKNVLFKHDGNQFIAEDGSTITSGNLNEYVGYYLQYMKKGWTLSMKGDICPALAEIVDALNAQLRAVTKKDETCITGLRIKYVTSMSIYEEDKVYVAFQYTTDGKKNSSDVDYEYKMEYNAGGVTLNYVGPRPTKTNTGETVLTAYPQLGILLNAINGTYTISSENPINPTLGCRFTNTSNSNLYMDATGTSK